MMADTAPKSDKHNQSLEIKLMLPFKDYIMLHNVLKFISKSFQNVT